MRRIVPLLLLAVGVGVAAASGARNGPALTDYRASQWLLERYEAVPADGEERREAIEKLQEMELLEPGETPELAAEDVRRGIEAAGRPQPTDRMVQWAQVGGLGWLLGVVMIAVGAVMARRQIAAETRGEGGGPSEVLDFPDALAKVRAVLDELTPRLATLAMDDDAPALRAEIDRLQIEVIEPVVNARGRFQARHGIGPFAEYFSPFSAGERYLARTWSALTDGHAEVARQALVSARDQFALAQEAWDRAEAG